MERIELITRTERRRTYREAEKAAVLAEAAAPGAKVREVSRRLGVAESLIYNWRSAQRRAQRIASEPLQFIPYGMVVTDGVPAPSNSSATLALSVEPGTASSAHVGPEELLRPPPAVRPGCIGLVLPGGVQVSVDSYVNEKALARVLRALRDAS